MATRSYKTWDTVSYTGYVPSYTYRSTPREETYYNPYSSYRSYYRSNRSLEDSGSRVYPRSGPYGSRFDFVNGRYSNDNRHTHLRDADEPTYYQELTDLYLTSNRLQQDYRDILDRYSAERRERGSGSGLPQGYGPPKYSNPDRLPASQRYGMYERTPRYGNRQYDTEITQYEPYSPSPYGRAQREDYQGSLGNVLYSKEMHKGRYNTHDSGPRTREDLDLWEYDPSRHGADRVGYERVGYDRSGYDRGGYGGRDYGDDFSREGDYMDTGDNSRLHGVSDRVNGGGLKKSASNANVEGISKKKAGRGDGSLGPLKDEFDSDSDLELENEMSGKLDSGIDSFEDDVLPVMEEDDLLDTLEEEVDIYIPEPTPEICVYNEISQEDFAQMQAELKAEEEKEKPLCEYPLIATVTTQHVKLEKIVGEFKTKGDDESPVNLSPLPGMTSCYVISPVPPADGDASLAAAAVLAADLSTSDPLAHEPEVKEVKLEFERETTPLGVSAEVVQVGEETIVTETEEEVVEHIPPESTVPDEVHLSLEPEMPAEFGDVVAKPIEETPVPATQEPAAEVAPAVPAEGEVTMTQAPVEAEKEKEAPVEQTEVAPVSLKIDSDAAQMIEKDGTSKTSAVNGEVEEKKTKEEVKEVKEEVKEVKEEVKEVKEEVKEVKEEVKEVKEEVKPAEKKASPNSETKTPKKVEETKSPVEKKGKLNTNKFGQSKFGQSKFGQQKSKAPPKKRLW